ncbi:MAG: ribosomal protein S18-alanine N-acetyltransferase [Acidobacteriota bacterium]|nr:MAG: ribosomal protein S18-alanine N-acetyltransferase [Acidobacteriota bacterium]
MASRTGIQPDEFAELALSIRKMKPGDLRQVIEIENKSFSNPWPGHCFQIILQDRSVWSIVACLDETVTGFLIGVVDGEGLLIADIAVDPAWRRHGIARKLLSAALLFARKQGFAYAVLDVRQSNEGAIRLYQGYGFIVVGKRPLYYSAPDEDALVMRLIF